MGQVQRTELVPEERVDTIHETEVVQRTVMVPKPVTEIVEEVKEVPRTVLSPRTVVDTVVESKSVPRTEMRAEERFEETKVLQFDPQTGTQLAGATVQGIRSEIE